MKSLVRVQVINLIFLVYVGISRSLTRWPFIGWLSLLIFAFPLPTIAQNTQPQRISRLVVHQTSDDLALWNLNADQSLNLIINLQKFPKPEVALDVSPSPDGQYIAYTGISNDSPMLILVSLNPLRVEQYAAPGIGSFQWSPDSGAILLSRPSIYLSGDSNILSNGTSYIFDLSIKTFSLVVETNRLQTIRRLRWLPSSEGIIYSVNVSGSPSSPSFENLYVMRRDGSDRQQLTYLETEAPQSIDFSQPTQHRNCWIPDFKWSAINARWYYILVCTGDDEHILLPSLFSVSLDGDNRLETDIYEQFPEQRESLLLDGYEIVDFFPTAQAVYLIINAPTDTMLIVSASDAKQAQIVSSIPSREGRFAAISPEKTLIGVSSNNHTAIIFNTINNQTQALELPDVSSGFCRIQWLNNETLLIDQVGACSSANRQFFATKRTIAWNILTETTIDVTASLGGLNLIIPIPENP